MPDRVDIGLPSMAGTTTRYDGDGNAARTTDGTGDVTTSSYDPQGRQVSETNPVSGTSVMTYSATNLVAQQDPQGNVTTDSYDGAGRLLSMNAPVSGTTQYQYDAVGNTVAITQLDRTTGVAIQVETRGYDALNRVITDTVSGPGGPSLTTLTAYDPDGNVAQVEQPKGDVTYNTYDLADQLTNVEIDPAPLSGPGAATHPKYEAYSYDAAGNTVQSVDADNRTTTTSYDGDNRVVQSVAASVAPTGTTTITTTLGDAPDGNTLSQTTRTSDTTSPGKVLIHTYTATYNADDWPTSSNDDGLVTNYGYDAAGQQRTQTVIDGSTPVTTQLNPEGLATSISESYGGSGPYNSLFGYNADDLPITETLPGGTGVTAQAQYDPDSRLTSLSWTGPNTGSSTTTLSSQYAYGYNAAGWTTALTTIVNGASTAMQYTHDAQGRLTSWSGQLNGPESWGYDGNGNIITNSEYLDNQYRTTVYTYSATLPNEEVQQHTDGYGVEYFGYDGHGDTTSITSTDPITSVYHVNIHLTYDAQERPITVTTLLNGAPITVSLGYNADGQRSSYTVITGTNQTLYSDHLQYRDGQVAQDSVVSATAGGSTVSYTDTFIYDSVGNPLELLRQQGGTTSRYWYEVDRNGSVIALTDSSGKVVDRYAYDPWGEGLPEGTSETLRQPLRYDGYWWDKELGWYWVGVRSYDPEGRWLQPDPSHADGVRTYAYVDDDPVDLTDPSGLGSQPTPTPTPGPTPGPVPTPTPIPSSQIGPCGRYGPQYAYCHAQENSPNWVVVVRCTITSSSALYLAAGGWPTCGATWPGLGTVTDDLLPSGYIDPFVVRFTQDTASWEFKNNQGTVGDLVKGLRDGSIKPQDLPPIKVVQRNGQLWSLDNRRLEAFRRAGVPIRYRLVNWSRSVSKEWDRKFTTRNNGESIRLRGEPEPEAPEDLEPPIDPIEPIEPIDPIV